MLLHQADSLLAAELSIPEPFAVVYACFLPTSDSNIHQLLDRARIQLLPHDTLLGSLLASVHIGHSSCIHVFAVTTIDGIHDATQRLAQLQLDGLAANYNGSTSALTKQFQESLQGLGVGSWSSASKTAYVIAWINVENKQGEDKGVVLIYPIALCLSFTPSPIPPRPPLEHIPSLPTALQPSPHISAQPPPTSISSASPQTPYPPPSVSYSQPRPVIPSSPSSDSVRAFRALTLSKSRDIHQIAAEIAGYVDAVARDREKERERLKRERESNNNASTSPKFARTAITSATATHSPLPISASAPLLTTPLSLASQPPVASTSHHPPSNFYPSPPQADATPHTGPTSPPTFLQPPPIPTIKPVSQPSEPPPPPVVPPPVYDPFSTTDASWTIQPQPYLGLNMNMDMDMDMDMDFDMNIGMDMNMSMPFDVNTSRDATFGGTSRTGDTGNGSGLDFDDITDDDFSFFDRPSAPAASTPLPRIMAITTTTTLPTPATTQTPLNFDSSPLFTTDISSATPCNASTPAWVSGGTHIATPAVPDLLPPSPGPTPPSHSAPATPTATVHLEPLISSNSTFDPIPFADYHRLLDGKYALGKFSLPSPTQGPDYLTMAENAGRIGWRNDYMAATDPRIGVVRKLIGVKRKLAFDPRGKVAKSPTSTDSPSWVDEWSSPSSTRIPSPDADIDSDATSSVSSRSPSPSPSPPHSRPTTPPPAYLPVGPTLLPTYFTHSSLLPLSTPLRRPSSPLPLPLPHSHPHIHSAAFALTPVSPAATLGESKSLEAAVGAVATEVVENSPWAEAWRASTLVGSCAQGEVWLADVRAISQLFGSVPGLEGSMALGSLFCDTGRGGSGSERRTESEKDKLKMLEAPMIAIGKGDAVIQVLPTALRFWEKLGLGPKGGAKNGTVFVLFEDDGEQRTQQVDAWLGSVATSYKVKSSSFNLQVRAHRS
ncbi:hypothetical protein C0992_012731 [Termitomyces sp. T32_za158]|nr:hypothetical protein C0992_012731 [Termitomyces sp. T32_za158]